MKVNIHLGFLNWVLIIASWVTGSEILMWLAMAAATMNISIFTIYSLKERAAKKKAKEGE